MKSIGYDDVRLSELQSQRKQLISSIREFSDKNEMLQSQLRRCIFNYRDPEPNFDRRKVKGLVCRLFNVKDPTYCMALETVGGGKVPITFKTKYLFHTDH